RAGASRALTRCGLARLAGTDTGDVPSDGVRREDGGLHVPEREHQVEGGDQQRGREHHELDERVAVLGRQRPARVGSAGSRSPYPHHAASSIARPCTVIAPAGPTSPTSGRVALTSTRMIPSGSCTAVASAPRAPPKRSPTRRSARAAPSSGDEPTSDA